MKTFKSEKTNRFILIISSSVGLCLDMFGDQAFA